MPIKMHSGTVKGRCLALAALMTFDIGCAHDIPRLHKSQHQKLDEFQGNLHVCRNEFLSVLNEPK